MTKQTTFPGIEDYMAPFFRHFQRLEGRELARCYVVGLMMQGERKWVEPMSERVNASERSMQRLLTEVKWDDLQGVIQEYRRGMVAETSDPQGVFVVDDTAFPKKGKDSFCVARQYCGSTGKVDNCQIGVSLTYVGGNPTRRQRCASSCAISGIVAPAAASSRLHGASVCAMCAAAGRGRSLDTYAILRVTQPGGKLP